MEMSASPFPSASTPPRSPLSSDSVSSFGKMFKSLLVLQHPPSHSTALMDQQRHPIRPINIRLPPELWILILRYATYPSFHSYHSSSSHQTNSIPLHIRLANYKSDRRWKASLTRVCKEWNLLGQGFLWEDVWIASGRDARVLVNVICGQGGRGRQVQMGRQEERRMDEHTVTTWSEIKVGTDKKEKDSGLARVRERLSLRDIRASNSTPAPLTSSPHPHPPQTPRRKEIAFYIKKLHIETPSMDKCCPFDLMLILQRCGRLEVFVDLRSIRRGFGVGRGAQVVGGLHCSQKGLGVRSMEEKTPGVSESIPQNHLFPSIPPYEVATSPDPILQALLRPTSLKPTLRHLSFTNYEYDSDDFRGGVRFWEDVIGKALSCDQGSGTGLNTGTGPGANLESLEVVMSTRGVGMGAGRGRVSAMGFDDYGYGYGYARRNPLALGSLGPASTFEGRLLTSLDINVHAGQSPSSIDTPISLTLSSLHSLRIPLTSPTLLVISNWFLPALQSLCVVSIDYTGWRRVGFKQLMDVHGGGLVRFEIVGGGDSGEEEGWITEREDWVEYSIGVGHPTTTTTQTQTTTTTNHQQQLHLPSTSPHLKHFICSSNASEWNWETPDWIAPHVLMPEHFGVERIGVWGLERRVRGDVCAGGVDTTVYGNGGSGGSGRGRSGRGRKRTISTWTTTSRWSRHSTSSDSSSTEDQDRYLEEPFFMLQEQFGSLLRKEAFPSLVCIRDMSWESDLIRRSVGIGGGGDLSSPSKSNVDPIPITSDETTTKKKRLKSKSSFANFKDSMASCFTSKSFSPSPSPTSPSFSSSSASSSTMTSSTSSESGNTTSTSTCTPNLAQSHKIRKFWLGVLEKCDRRGVYLEDWMGRRVVA